MRMSDNAQGHFMAEKGTNSKKKNKAKAARNTVAAVLLTVLSIVIIAVGACFLVLNHYLDKIVKVDPTDTEDVIPPSQEEFITDDWDGKSDETRDPDDTGKVPSVEDPNDVKWPEDIASFNDDHLVNILLVGQDRRPGQKRERSDSMILVSVNPDTKEVSLVSFLRDTYVQIPGGYSDNRLNYAYKAGGFKLLKETLNKNFGVTVDGCFECDFNDFEEIIDLLGGVEINVTKREASYMKSEWGIKVSSGKTRLNGHQALMYARIRAIGSDFERTQRQRTILTTLFEEFKNASVSELTAIADEILPKLATDMTNSQIIGLMGQMIPLMSSMKISQHAVPYDGAYRDAKIRGMQVLIPDLGKIRKKLAEEFLPL